MSSTICTCPKTTENGAVVRAGRDMRCPMHGDLVPCDAPIAPTLAQKCLRRALENGARMLEEEARRRRHVLLGGAEACEMEAKLIRTNLEPLCKVDVVKEGTQT